MAVPAIHPLLVRITHWTNATTVMVMIASGWQIYNASPILPFRFPEALTLGGSLDSSFDAGCDGAPGGTHTYPFTLSRL